MTPGPAMQKRQGDIMYASGITQELIDKAVAFHGHTCPGISLGIRVAAWAMQHFGTAADEEIVAVTETDMCAVDAIQALVGCTFGKGNLIFRDRGKVAFTFFRRSDNKSARLVQILRDDAISRRSQEIRNALSAKHLSEEDRTRLELEREQLRQKSMEQILSLPFEELFSVGEARCATPADHCLRILRRRRHGLAHQGSQRTKALHRLC